MKAIKTDNCTGVLRGEHLSTPEAPVFDLPVEHVQNEQGCSVRSFWMPSDNQVLLLARGGCVVLDVLGSTHPPLKLGVGVFNGGKAGPIKPEEVRLNDLAVKAALDQFDDIPDSSETNQIKAGIRAYVASITNQFGR